ncbi:MAG: 23S rRNA (pseudouridine(1915)-N(3))-methyltransferase RlmH [Bacteroidia bacterium]|nr:23S rRNA (pseudouridine(1915)-N(3))-methyltransferase RlmH [Bacteroidia bacterium]
MKLELIMIEKNSEKFINDGYEHFLNKINHYAKTEVHVLRPPPELRKKSIDEQKKAEAEMLKKYMTTDAFKVLLDEKGQKMNSVEFSKELGKWLSGSQKKIRFFIGGPYGVYDPLKKDFQLLLSLSDMTFSHQIIRLIFLEQLYRAFTILRGEKYHHT